MSNEEIGRKTKKHWHMALGIYCLTPWRPGKQYEGIFLIPPTPPPPPPDIRESIALFQGSQALHACSHNNNGNKTIRALDKWNPDEKT